MSGIASYILTVTAAAMLAAIIRQLAGGGALGTLVKYLAGLFVAITVLSPLIKLDLPDISKWLSDFKYTGQEAAAAGENMAQDARRELIKEELEAYILDKAAACGVSAEVEIVLDDAHLPVSAVIRGEIPREAQEELAQMMESELGIRREAQRWTDRSS